MSSARALSINCDESCKLGNDGIPDVALVAVSCEAHVVRKLSEQIPSLIRWLTQYKFNKGVVQIRWLA